MLRFFCDAFIPLSTTFSLPLTPRQTETLTRKPCTQRRLRPSPDPALYPSQIPFHTSATVGEDSPVAQRVWGGRDVNARLTLDEFADALSGVCVRALVGVGVYACMRVMGVRVCA